MTMYARVDAHSQNALLDNDNKIPTNQVAQPCTMFISVATATDHTETAQLEAPSQDDT